MTIKHLAKQIPDQVRRQVLLTDEDIIFSAISVKDNKNMKILLQIWHEFIEPDKEISDCPICIGTILSNFRQMKEALISLEMNDEKMKAL